MAQNVNKTKFHRILSSDSNAIVVQSSAVIQCLKGGVSKNLKKIRYCPSTWGVILGQYLIC